MLDVTARCLVQQRPADAVGGPSRPAGRATYRAWRATALALIVVGVFVGWLPGSPAPSGVFAMLGGALVLAGVVTLVAGRRRGRAISLAVGTGGPLPATRLPFLVSGVVVGASLLLVVLVVMAGRG
jgi:inner membrane protein YidH